MRTLLSGIVGSVAYGLAGPDSDVDRLGVFAVPTTELHGLRRPEKTHVHVAPDRTLHEAAKWCRLALQGNPTVLELVWLPEELYEVRTELGQALIDIRRAFASARRVRAAYLGFATSQVKKLGRETVPRSRRAKSARHLARLVHQGRELYTTGRLPVRLANPQWFRDFGERVADGDLYAARVLLAQAEDDFAATRTPLPERPDEAAVERWLRAMRAAHLED
ncbi:nucleotidyltransferase domain-containing protein [Nocardiopsis synnemataformans]|uniref:nucleotidyltransferase domain-containing protein n=1 Tax=Nocardiopsis synnemataformans TaxID=61305 RepID=UPI003EBABD9F